MAFFSSLFNIKQIGGLKLSLSLHTQKKMVGTSAILTVRASQEEINLHGKFNIKLWISVLQCAICVQKNSGSRGWG